MLDEILTLPDDPEELRSFPACTVIEGYSEGSLWLKTDFKSVPIIVVQVS